MKFHRPTCQPSLRGAGSHHLRCTSSMKIAALHTQTCVWYSDEANFWVMPADHSAQTSTRTAWIALQSCRIDKDGR